MEKRYPHRTFRRTTTTRCIGARPCTGSAFVVDGRTVFQHWILICAKNCAWKCANLLKDIGATCLLVTHDQQDAFAFGERVGVMKNGAIQQWDTAYNMYHEPATRFVANFIGEGVFLDGVVKAGNEIETELAALHGDTDHPPGTAVKVLIRPDDIIHDDDSPRAAKIKKRAFRGENYLYTLVLPSGAEILSLVPSHHNHAVGEDLGIKLEIDHLVVFAA